MSVLNRHDDLARRVSDKGPAACCVGMCVCANHPPPTATKQVCSLKTGTIRNLCDPTYKWLEGKEGRQKEEKGRSGRGGKRKEEKKKREGKRRGTKREEVF